MPVPIVTENQDGEKLRTTRRQPVLFLSDVFKSGRDGEAIDVDVASGPEMACVVSLRLERAPGRIRCAAVLVTAGLSMFLGWHDTRSRVTCESGMQRLHMSFELARRPHMFRHSTTSQRVRRLPTKTFGYPGYGGNLHILPTAITLANMLCICACRCLQLIKHLQCWR